MQLYRSLDTSGSSAPIALTIGAFDGIHLGHEHLIQQVRAAAARIGGESAVLTFDPHPDRVLRPDTGRLYLTSLDERIGLLEAQGIDHLFVLRFDPALSRVEAQAFMEQVCGAMRLRELWVGPDFRLGAGGRGTLPVLRSIGQSLNFTVHEIDRLLVNGRPVSSTEIRQLLRDGAADAANELLGRPFALVGEVVHGDHRGRTIGFPTANLAVPDEQFLPADGVYACRVELPGEPAVHPVVTNVGVRPTFGSLRRTVEAHLIDWSGDLYGKHIRVVFLHRLRPERKFAGIDALVAQIRADVVEARDFLAARPATHG